MAIVEFLFANRNSMFEFVLAEIVTLEDVKVGNGLDFAFRVFGDDKDFALKIFYMA